MGCDKIFSGLFAYLLVLKIDTQQNYTIKKCHLEIKHMEHFMVICGSVDKNYDLASQEKYLVHPHKNKLPSH